MEFNQYAYLWTNENYDYVLVKETSGYMIMNRSANEMLLIEDEKLANEIINRMLQRGLPVYNSYEDLVNKCAPVNIVGQPSLPDDFPVKRYKVSIEWLEEPPLVVQVKELKKAFLQRNSMSNQELLDIARNSTKWQFDMLYLDEDQKAEMKSLAEKHGLKIVFELDELGEGF